MKLKFVAARLLLDLLDDPFLFYRVQPCNFLIVLQIRPRLLSAAIVAQKLEGQDMPVPHLLLKGEQCCSWTVELTPSV